MPSPNIQSSTQSVLSTLIILGQCFALFPVKGIQGSNFKTIKFSWRSKRTLYAVSYLIIISINFGLCVLRQINSKEFLSPFSGLVHLLTVLLVAIFFIDLAKKWPTLMKKWTAVDQAMTSYISNKINIDREFKIIVTFVMVSAAVEHALFVASKSRCVEYDLTLPEKIETYFKLTFDEVFSIVPYTIYLGIFMQILRIFCLFAWNYMDLFIMIVSMMISYRFAQIVRKLKLMLRYKIANEIQWRTVREDYMKLNLLCKSVDRAISNIVILSFMNNLFMVLIQFLHIIHNFYYHPLIQQIYFIYSFGYSIIRTIFVCLYAATVDSESKKPLNILNAASSNIYNSEIERFIVQVKVDPAYLSGKQFFVITKSLVLDIAEAIVTYELVLIQIYNFK